MNLRGEGFRFAPPGDGTMKTAKLKLNLINPKLDDKVHDDFYNQNLEIIDSIFGPDVRIMTGDEIVTWEYGFYKRYLLNPDVTDRNVTPVAGYPVGFELVLVNIGYGKLITFDPSGLNQAISPGQAGIFYFDGTNWR